MCFYTAGDDSFQKYCLVVFFDIRHDVGILLDIDDKYSLMRVRIPTWMLSISQEPAVSYGYQDSFERNVTRLFQQSIFCFVPFVKLHGEIV